MMITVTIMGILAAIAFPNYQNDIIRSQTSESIALAYGLKTLFIAINLQEGTWFAHNATGASAIHGVDSLTGKYGIAIINSTIKCLPHCTIQDTFNGKGILE